MTDYSPLPGLDKCGRFGNDGDRGLQNPVRWTYIALALLAAFCSGAVGAYAMLIALRPDVSPSHSFLTLRRDCYVDVAGLGRVQGTSDNYGHSFYGIRYGWANRWQAPTPAAKPWHPAVYDATEPKDECIQPGGTLRGSEQCLHLDVHTPNVGQSQRLGPAAVIVWLHGGSFIFGASSDTQSHMLRELMQTNQVILVSVAYRLGLLGFLGSSRMRSIGESSTFSSGNYGILDQQMALQWIHKHVESFGGDVKGITLLGWSAGAASVSVHLAMPSSAGLFARAVMLSGGFSNWASCNMSVAEVNYEAVLRRSVCSAEPDCWNEGPPCTCLLSLPIDAIASLDSGFAASPIVDGSILPKHPADAVSDGSIHQGVEIMLGSTLEDSMIDIGAEASETDFRQYLSTLLPPPAVERAFHLYTSAASDKENLYQHYPLHVGWSPFYWAARRAYADSVNTCPARRAAQRWRHVSGAKAYWYLWGVEMVDLRSIRSSGGACWPCPGVAHGADLEYLFNSGSSHVNPSAAQLATLYPTFIADFAKSGDPNYWNGFSLSGSQSWLTVENGGMGFDAAALHFSTNQRAEICSFWDEFQHVGASV